MPRRKAEARWRGNVRDGSGELALGSGIWRGPYDWGSRFEEGATTNPEELLAAAHAGCFTMALSAELTKAGTPPTLIESAACVTLSQGSGGPEITSIEIDTHLLFSDVYIESSGGENPGICHGHTKGDAVEMKELIERYQTEYYKRT